MQWTWVRLKTNGWRGKVGDVVPVPVAIAAVLVKNGQAEYIPCPLEATAC